MPDTEKLNQQLAIGNALRFEATPSGLVRAIVATPKAEATLYLQGAHLASWTPRGQQPVLFLSSHSELAPGRAIRGGVPIIFPWFGARSDGRPGPQHGFARTSLWSVESAALRKNGDMALTFLLLPNKTTRSFGYDNFELQFSVTISYSLHMELETRNLAHEPLKIGEALHSYYSVSDLRHVAVTGLDHATYLDHAEHDVRKQQTGPLQLSAETDRLFVNTDATCTIEDPSWQRRIVIEKSGSHSTVVWNPWAEKAVHMADLGDEWRRFVCVETANAADNVVLIEPGQTHRMSATVRVESIG
jgi:glucose-6-phosphate 1-epimerase